MQDKPERQIDLSSLRRNYQKDSIASSSLNKDPFEQFRTWFGQAISSDLVEPNAMILATSGFDTPTTRTVLLKSFDKSGFVFYTNYKSRKAKQITANPLVSLLFPWYPLEKQVIILGEAHPINRDESFAYFKSRPYQSQIGAWASSDQSQVIDSREYLEKSWDKYERQFKDKEVPLPDYWGGYRVFPKEFEFWQGREKRLHDRFRYRLIIDDSENPIWAKDRLSP